MKSPGQAATIATGMGPLLTQVLTSPSVPGDGSISEMSMSVGTLGEEAQISNTPHMTARRAGKTRARGAATGGAQGPT